jgi:hypothetical protein
MGIALSLSNGGYVDLTSSGWENLLSIAAKNGWEPLGTVPHKWNGIAPEKWDGNYFSCDHQTVCAEDALGIAAALELAVSDLEESPVEWIKEIINVRWIKEFVDICRSSGGIMICG